MRVVVTGGAGFIGSALCRHMVAQRADDSFKRGQTDLCCQFRIAGDDSMQSELPICSSGYC